MKKIVFVLVLVLSGMVHVAGDLSTINLLMAPATPEEDAMLKAPVRRLSNAFLRYYDAGDVASMERIYRETRHFFHTVFLTYRRDSYIIPLWMTQLVMPMESLLAYMYRDIRNKRLDR